MYSEWAAKRHFPASSSWFGTAGCVLRRDDRSRQACGRFRYTDAEKRSLGRFSLGRFSLGHVRPRDDNQRD